MRYIVIFQSVIGSDFEISYSWDQQKFRMQKDAIAHGFKTRESDDFNIGMLRNGVLVWFGWMDEALDHDLREIASEIGVKAPRKTEKAAGGAR